MIKAKDQPNIIKIYEKALDQNYVKNGKVRERVNYIVLEYAKGGCLSDLIYKNKIDEANAKFFSI